MLLLARLCGTMLVLGVLLPAQARAATLLYELSGAQNVTFTVPLNPAPDTVLPDGFVIRGISVTLDGRTSLADIGFAEEFAGGGLIILSDGLNLSGPQLFSGTNAAPTLLQDQFSLFDISDPAVRYTLSVRPLAAAVPEPSTWLMLLVGFAAVGAGMRRGRAGKADVLPGPLAPV